MSKAELGRFSPTGTESPAAHASGAAESPAVAPPQPQRPATADRDRKPFTVPDLQRAKDEGRRFAMLTAYDYTMAHLLDAAGIEVLLVGDSLGMVMLGHPTTVPVTMDEVIHHARAVTRVPVKALVVGDLPFGSYQTSTEQAVHNATRLMKEGGVQAVKLEGGGPTIDAVHAITEAGIPVMAHIGLTPQHVHAMGGFKVQGKTQEQQARLRRDAKALQDAGATSIVLEGIPSSLGRQITADLHIPTIGIGAGPDCDGQVLVVHDMLGLNPPGTRQAKFVKRYADLGEQVIAAARRYKEEVEQQAFPTEEHGYKADAGRPEEQPGEREVRYGS